MLRNKFVRLLNGITAFSFLGIIFVYFKQPSTISNDGKVNFARNLTTAAISTPLTKGEIIASVEFLNKNLEVFNVHQYGQVDKSEIVIVVQVHNRSEYLRHLIESLGKAKYIERSLLIFSHDYSSPQINRLIREIKFCRVMQIFFPYNIQLFPNSYPGDDPADCPPNFSPAEAENFRCNNWMHPDKYGHYRVARLTQIKHHWWWKINYVFDRIIVRHKINNPWVLLLEEDHYVSADFLHVLYMIIKDKNRLCAVCDIISLGYHLKNFDTYEADISKLGVYPWFSSKHNMGMALNSEAWKLIRNCSNLFCTYDDYNWDWSLLHLSTHCLRKRLSVITAKAPRVLHIGDCGVHTNRCGVDSAAEQAKKLFGKAEHLMFPKVVHVSEFTRRTLKPSNENGGWGDERDHDLCKRNSDIQADDAYQLIPSRRTFNFMSIIAGRW